MNRLSVLKGRESAEMFPGLIGELCDGGELLGVGVECGAFGLLSAGSFVSLRREP